MSRAVPLSEGHWSQRATSLGCHPPQSFAEGLSKPQGRNIPVPGQHPSPRHRLAWVSSTASFLLCINRGLVNLAYFSSPKHFLDTSKIFKASKQTKTNRLGNIKAGFFYPCLIDPRVQRFLQRRQAQNCIEDAKTHIQSHTELITAQEEGFHAHPGSAAHFTTREYNLKHGCPSRRGEQYPAQRLLNTKQADSPCAYPFSAEDVQRAGEVRLTAESFPALRLVEHGWAAVSAYCKQHRNHARKQLTML